MIGERIDLVIRKEGSQWCLYTSDGARKLGCHPTEEEAKAQEAAIEARGRNRDAMQYEPIELSEIDVTEGQYETLDNGDVLKWVRLAEPGEKWVNGQNEFSITPERIQEAIANFESRRKAPLPVTFDHAAGGPARAWIEDIQLRDDGWPWGQLHILRDSWAAIQKGEYKYFSLEFYNDGTDQKGKDIGFEIVGGAILNDPFFPSARLDNARTGAFFSLSRFNVSPNAGNKNPGKGEPMDLKDVKIDGDKVTLSREQYGTLVKLSEENASMRGQLEEAKGKEQANERRILQLERTTGASRIRAAIKTLQRDHRVVVQTGDFAIESSDAECFEWLETAPMGVTTIEGLEKLARDQEATVHLPRIPGGKEVGGGSDRLPPEDLTTEAGRKEAVRRGMAQLARDSSKAELELMFARRRQTAEQFIRQELANANPMYRKQLLEGN